MRVLYKLWSSLPDDLSQPKSTHDHTHTIIQGEQDISQNDPDLLDSLLEDEEIGLILRTDYTNEDAWNVFLCKILDAQKEFLSALHEGTEESGGEKTQEDASMTDGVDDAREESDSDSNLALPDIVKIVNPQETELKQKLSNISNIAALRLFNDVDIRMAPDRPEGTKRVSPSNPLIDQQGYQEIYAGKNIWIYDAHSNIDGCARAVAQTSDFYGTAT